MTIKHDGLIVIGENFNTTRKIKGSSPRVVQDDDGARLTYTDLDGSTGALDISDVYPKEPDEQKNFPIPHIAQALRDGDMAYMTWIVKNQEAKGAHIIDVCVDEISHWPEERMKWMRTAVKTIQEITDKPLSLDSSDGETIRAGLEVYDRDRSRPAINSVNLEEPRIPLIAMAKEYDAILFANAGGAVGMPADDVERVENLSKLMDMMDDAGIAMDDRYLDPLVFPIGAGPEFGNHYLDAVRTLRKNYPEVHIFGGHSNVSFGLPGRKILNNAFIALSVLAGCDSVMIDPVMNPVLDSVEFKLATEVLTAVDEYSVKYIKYWRKKS